VPLSDGDRIRICEHEFVFDLEPRDLGERSDGKDV
jgi:pSer/pThr/pTyr-binding forkhead associated (FHA) protein